MPEITPLTQKRRNYPGEISRWCGLLCFISAFAYIAGLGKGWESLYTSTVAEYLYCIGGNLWLISTALGLLSWFISLFFWASGCRATGTIAGLLIPMFMSCLITPTLGRAHPHDLAYYPVSDPAAIQYIQEFSKSTEKFDRQFIKDTYKQDYSDYDYDKNVDTDTITVKYELRPSVERTDLPKSFTVLIDRKTKKTEIKHENDVQQKAK